MCMFALTVSRTEPKNIKEAMADSAWIESIQEELDQFDRLDVLELNENDRSDVVAVAVVKVEEIKEQIGSYALSWKPCQGDSLNLPDHRCVQHLQKQATPKNVDMADDEFILHVEGTATSQRVIRHIRKQSWPGKPAECCSTYLIDGDGTFNATGLDSFIKGDYDLWLMRIEQYFLMTDYSLWEVIKNGNKVLKKTIGDVEQVYEPTSAKEKIDMKNEMKAKGTLLMAIPNKDQLKFHSYKDAKLLMEAIEKRLQKLISRLEIRGKVITHEDMNLKLLRSLPCEWKTHALIWRNKQEIETISLDDLNNNLKIYEPKISRSSSTSQNPQNVAFVSSNSTNSNSNTNEADNTAYGVSAAHTQSNPASGDNLSDAMYNTPCFRMEFGGMTGATKLKKSILHTLHDGTYIFRNLPVQIHEYEDYDGGFVSFGDGKGGIFGKVLSSDFKASLMKVKFIDESSKKG
ncbi:hypothetical protein Tco_0748253 [Tanacetum coccineum]|uniref:Uncharacterized protein n=1 Tax=Tanacetum coccineum TaxID=301880 RepID=A0ABQ4YXT8_9ASTR